MYIGRNAASLSLHLFLIEHFVIIDKNQLNIKNNEMLLERSDQFSLGDYVSKPVRERLVLSSTYKSRVQFNRFFKLLIRNLLSKIKRKESEKKSKS